ncbi:hypothetical protein ACH5RR_024122 [Cinchona calisaya]|uniref:KIB1-4 beta-propeller domain-containing protein n=1 Tax=Cinchona calisaya TaxID=153742 RepID=A0ABD2ZCL0_9GENT
MFKARSRSTFIELPSIESLSCVDHVETWPSLSHGVTNNTTNERGRVVAAVALIGWSDLWKYYTPDDPDDAFWEYYTPNFVTKHVIRNLVLSSDPEVDEHSLILAVQGSCESRKFAFCRPRKDKKWTVLEDSNPSSYQLVYSEKHKNFYTFGREEGTIEAWEVLPSDDDNNNQSDQLKK